MRKTTTTTTKTTTRLMLSALLLCLWLASAAGSHVDDDNNRPYTTTIHRPFPPRRPGGFVASQRKHPPSNTDPPPPYTIANLTCDYFTQPLNHFDLPRNASGVYQQRFCYTNMFLTDPNNIHRAPVLLYTGNESPLEEYINHTGLLWQSAGPLGAQVVFLEHRYEGQSVPPSTLAHCLAYATSFQALADYANFIEQRLFLQGTRRRPVVVMGGSYGGMLAAWMRMLYPHLVAGAIAGSAPVGGFPHNRPTAVDGAYRVIRHGLAQPFPPTLKSSSHDDDDDVGAEPNHCPHNLLAVWPLLQILSQEATGQSLLQDTLRLCHVPPTDASPLLLAWAQAPWFDLAEGSFPYPSAYISFALTHRDVKLPAWPLQAACWNASRLHADWGVRIDGNQTDVRYNVTYSDSGLTIAVDWDQATPYFPCDSSGGGTMNDHDKNCWTSLLTSDSIRGLLESVRDAVSIWYNVTKDVTCYNLTAAPNVHSSTQRYPNQAATTSRTLLRISDNKSAAEQCADRMAEGSWPSICCNEEMNLIITAASGLGQDAFWPPTYPRGTKSYADIAKYYTDIYQECRDPNNIFGFPQAKPDPWALWMDIRYGGLHVSAHSNIIFSNGLLDPWSAAGVYATGGDPASRDPTDPDNPHWQPYRGIPGLYVQNITNDNDRMIALIMDVGGHHTDLMFSNEADPPCVRGAREVERTYMRRWIDEFWTQV